MSSSASAPASKSIARLDKFAKGKVHSPVSARAIFVWEFPGKSGKYFDVLMSLCEDVDIPYVKVPPKQGTSGTTKIEPASGTAAVWHRKARYILSMRRFQPSDFRAGDVLMLQGLYFDISHIDKDNKRYCNTFVRF